MTVPSLGLTFDDLRTRVADFMGIPARDSNNIVGVPTDLGDLDKVSRLVNDGYRRFLTAFDWEFMTPEFNLTFIVETTGTVTTAGNLTFADSGRTEADDAFNGYQVRVVQSNGASQVRTVLDFVNATGTFTLDSPLSPVASVGEEYSLAPASSNVDGQGFRYRMPDDFFGEIRGMITYDTNSGISVSMKVVGESEIRALRSGTSEPSGDPTLIAFRPLPDGNGWEALVWPTPGTANTIIGRYRRFPNKMVNGTDRPICGFQHDTTLEACCRAAAEVKGFDQQGVWEKIYQTELVKSIAMDKKSRGRSMGQFTDPSDEAFVVAGAISDFPLTQVIYNNVTVS